MKRYGSDAVVDLLIEAGIEHVALNPGASFRGIHDSLVNTDGAPGIVLCLHEEIAVAVAHGYAKAAASRWRAAAQRRRPAAPAMAIYNAWCDRAPMMVLGGTGPKSRPAPALDRLDPHREVQGNLVRDFVKWDDQPTTSLRSRSRSRAGDTPPVTEPPARLPLLRRRAPGGRARRRPRRRGAGALPGERVAAGTARLRDRGDGRASLRCRPAPRSSWSATIESIDELGELAELLDAPVIDTGVRFALPRLTR